MNASSACSYRYLFKINYFRWTISILWYMSDNRLWKLKCIKLGFSPNILKMQGVSLNNELLYGSLPPRQGNSKWTGTNSGHVKNMTICSWDAFRHSGDTLLRMYLLGTLNKSIFRMQKKNTYIFKNKTWVSVKNLSTISSLYFGPINSNNSLITYNALKNE